MSDPTGTAGIRRSFQAEANRRLAQLQSQTHVILVERDLMAARNDPLAVLMPNPGHRLSAFTEWFTRTANGLLIAEQWWDRFLQRAFESGAAAGGELVGRPPRGYTPVPAVYRELAAGEFAGIAQALIQQVNRQAGMAAISGRKPTLMYRAVLTSLRKVGQARMKSAVNSLTVQLHNTARLAQFQAAGVTHVGINAERLEPRRPSRFLKHDHRMHDASAEEELRRLRQVFERQRAEAEERAAAAEVAAERARAALEAQIAAELAGEAARESKAAAQAELEAARERARAEVAAERARTAERNLELKAQSEAVKAAREAERRALHPAPRPTETGIPRPQPEFKGPPGYETVRRLLLGKPSLPARLLGIGAEFVNVLTAGDDRVCQRCQELAEEGPYSLLEAWGMLPAHVDCRCAFVPAFDNERNQELEADIE